MLLSLINSHTHIPNSHRPLPPLNYPDVNCLIFVHNPQKRSRKHKKDSIFTRGLGFSAAKTKIEGEIGNYWCCSCKQSDVEVELESEIMEFMEKSEKPTMFPTKEELIKGGRMDLVQAIRKKGGWYSLGWDEENDVKESINIDIEELQKKFESCEFDNDSIWGEKEDGFCSDSDSNSNSEDLNSVEMVSSSSGRLLEINGAEDTGVEGILNRLEKQRNYDFGIDLQKHRYKSHASRKDEEEDGTSLDEEAIADIGGKSTGFHQNGVVNKSGGVISQKLEPETWRTWSNQRAGFQHTEFEAAEISFSKNTVERDKESYHDDINANTKEYSEAWDKIEEINHAQIKTRLWHLEYELSTTLQSLRSKSEENIIKEALGSPSIDFHKLSDDQEFQENELMSAQERLRSIRAKLAILEGKMNIAINGAQKVVDQKQKRIDVARKAFQLLRSTSIVWPNSSAEVLLTGSFDGWTTQRKMEKSKTGVFSVCLMLYPGRYEIKFIVDGIWKVDPLRPVVKNGGYENNLLIVT